MFKWTKSQVIISQVMSHYESITFKSKWSSRSFFFSVKSRLKVRLSFYNTRVTTLSLSPFMRHHMKTKQNILQNEVKLEYIRTMTGVESESEWLQSTSLPKCFHKNIPFSFVSRSSQIPKLLVFIFSFRYMIFSAFPPHQLFECRVTQCLCAVGLPSSVFIPVYIDNNWDLLPWTPASSKLPPAV